MERLTKDLGTPHDDTTYADIVKDAVDRENICLTRLKHHEDIEERLGIDLLTLFKALDKGVYYKTCQGEIYFQRHPYLAKKCLCVRNRMKKYLSDYGKTWSITKEELEK